METARRAAARQRGALATSNGCCSTACDTSGAVVACWSCQYTLSSCTCALSSCLRRCTHVCASVTHPPPKTLP